MFILPKKGALVTKLPNLPKDVKVNKFDSTSGKVHYQTLLSSYLRFLLHDVTGSHVDVLRIKGKVKEN